MKIPEKSGDWVLVYPNCPNVPNTLKHFTILEQSLISSRMISWRLEVTFCIILPMILGISPLFGPSFLPKNPKTGETQPSNGFYTWVRLQLLWNVEFNTFDEFLYIQDYDLRYLGPISWTCSGVQNTLKQVQINPQMIFTFE